MAFDRLIKKNAYTEDTLKLIIRTVNEAESRGFGKEVVKALAGLKPAIHLTSNGHIPDSDKLDFMHRLFAWVCRNVEYTKDPEGSERVHTAPLTVHNGKGDCKKCATLLSSVLAEAGIESILKWVTYEGNEDYTHIYVIVPYPDNKKYIVLDPTNDCKWNSEVTYKSATLYFLNGKVMELRQVGAPNKPLFDFSDNIMTPGIVGLDQDFHALGVGKGFKFLHKFHFPSLKGIINDIKNIEHTFAEVSFAIPRAVYLEAVRLNVAGHAGHLLHGYNKDATKLMNFWKAVGGNPNALKAALLQGSAKHPLLGPPNNSQVGIAPLALLAAAAPIVAAAAATIHAIDPNSPVANDLNKVANTAATAAAVPFNPIATMQAAGLIPDAGPGTSPTMPPGSQFNPPGYIPPGHDLPPNTGLPQGGGGGPSGGAIGLWALVVIPGVIQHSWLIHNYLLFSISIFAAIILPIHTNNYFPFINKIKRLCQISRTVLKRLLTQNWK